MPTFEEITRHHDNDPSENPWVNGPPPPERVAIVAYKPEWPRRYQAAAAEIRAALGEAVVEIEHVGSTSVDGLAAKDVIDIDLTVADPRVGVACRSRHHVADLRCHHAGCIQYHVEASSVDAPNDFLMHQRQRPKASTRRNACSDQ